MPCATYDFARWKNKEGVVTPNFVPKNGRLVHGNELLAKVIEDYPKRSSYKAREYTISSVVALIHILRDICTLPIGYEKNSYIEKPIDLFIGYLMFDCLISNLDRHHENWGIIIDNETNKIHLAPTYDHASGFGCRVSDKEIKQRINTKDQRYTVSNFVARAKSAFAGKNMKRVSTLDSFLFAAKQSPKAAKYWLSKLENISLRQTEIILSKVPTGLISKPSVRFAVEILDANRKRLLNCERAEQL